ncbi:MAG: hypothetical protein AVDCRST_MAG20-242 [uncultured Acidimicrobiales bacterium]|uniref:Uncharacterized protein n=1 Tax=uncultured Acidimicrobiales bacterium TaxID=310071 RepID=A0A6J4H517_9ACTN|nr:MAG: hypothetical protein AVDCRST_MAG20-242 [uncultured Acidimicrobiales bacterium]
MPDGRRRTVAPSPGALVAVDSAGPRGPVLPVGGDRPDLDGAAVAGRRDPGGEVDGDLGIVGLEHEVPPDRPLRPVDRARRGDGAALLDPDRGRLVGQAEREAGREPRRLVHRGVVGVDPPLLVLGQRLPRRSTGQGGGSLVDQQDVLHVGLLVDSFTDLTSRRARM